MLDYAEWTDHPSNARFLANSWEDIRYLLALVEDLQKLLDMQSKWPRIVDYVIEATNEVRQERNTLRSKVDAYERVRPIVVTRTEDFTRAEIWDKQSTYQLTELQYSNDRKGPWRLYIYEADGVHHRGGASFGKETDDEVISIVEAKVKALSAMGAGREVRVTDGGDNLVFHAKGPNILYPATGDFWKEIQ